MILCGYKEDELKIYIKNCNKIGTLSNSLRNIELILKKHCDFSISKKAKL